MGEISDSVEDRSGNKKDSLWLDIPGISAADAALLNAIVDPSTDPTKDTVLYNTPVGGTTTVRWRVTPGVKNTC